MVEGMLQRLQALPWRRIDVSFAGSLMPLAHNHIQVSLGGDTHAYPHTHAQTRTLANLTRLASLLHGQVCAHAHGSWLTCTRVAWCLLCAQVTRKWLNFEGKSVAVHLGDQLVAMETEWRRMQQQERQGQGQAQQRAESGQDVPTGTTEQSEEGVTVKAA